MWYDACIMHQLFIVSILYANIFMHKKLITRSLQCIKPFLFKKFMVIWILVEHLIRIRYNLYYRFFTCISMVIPTCHLKYTTSSTPSISKKKNTNFGDVLNFKTQQYHKVQRFWFFFIGYQQISNCTNFASKFYLII